MSKQSGEVSAAAAGSGADSGEKREVPKVIGRNHYTHHIIRKMPLKLAHIRKKKAA